MVSDSKQSPPQSPISAFLDAPPSYDTLAPPSPSAQGASSSSSPLSHPRLASSPPKETLHLFSGPPNPEPLLSRLDTPLEVLNNLEIVKKGLWFHATDKALQNRTSGFRAFLATRSALRFRHVSKLLGHLPFPFPPFRLPPPVNRVEPMR